MYVCAGGEVTWRMDEVNVGGAMDLRLGMAGWCYDVTIGGGDECQFGGVNTVGSYGSVGWRYIEIHCPQRYLDVGVDEE